MGWVGSNRATAADNTSAATVEVPKGQEKYAVSIYAVDDNGDISTPGAGTVALTAQMRGAPSAETVYGSDGTTAVSVDLTATNPKTVSVQGFNVDSFIATPSSLSANHRVVMVVEHA